MTALLNCDLYPTGHRDQYFLMYSAGGTNIACQVSARNVKLVRRRKSVPWPGRVQVEVKSSRFDDEVLVELPSLTLPCSGKVRSEDLKFSKS